MLTTEAKTAIAAGLLWACRARTPGTPAGDKDEAHPDNTFGLPEGAPIRKKFKQFGRRQRKKVLASLPADGQLLPHVIEDLSAWDDPMSDAMTPILTAYWDEAGQEVRTRLGLESEAWEVHDPHLHRMIRQQSMDFCASTNGTTHKALSEALADLRKEFHAGLVDAGEAIPLLRDRVIKVFQEIDDFRAERIARTEASRAVHRASMQSAQESGVVLGKVWLAAANSCPRCLELERKSREHPLPLDHEFDRHGEHAEYAVNKEPPAHPFCRCTVTFTLTDEYASMLEDKGTPTGYRPGPLGPDPSRSPSPNPKAEAP